MNSQPEPDTRGWETDGQERRDLVLLHVTSQSARWNPTVAQETPHKVGMQSVWGQAGPQGKGDPAEGCVAANPKQRDWGTACCYTQAQLLLLCGGRSGGRPSFLSYASWVF